MPTTGHPDPLDPAVPRPRPADWEPLRRAAFAGPAMEAYREGLRLPGLPDVRAAVLDDLSAYYGVDAEEVVYRATHSFELGAEEWKARERDSEAGIRDFYVNLQSWAFGQLWYAYLQAEGYAWPAAAIIAHDLGPQPPARVLDFGSGVGAGAMMFALLGHRVSLADVSTPLLEFARFRFERRGRSAAFIDLNHQPLPPASAEVITAIQTLAHVPDIGATGRALHAALVRGGTLYADIDVHPRTEGDSRLYDDDLPGRLALRHSGFAEERAVPGTTIRYRSVARSGLGSRYRALCDTVVLGAPRRRWRRLRYG